MLFWKSSEQKRLELLRDIVERLEKLERRMQGLELDWENVYDKIRSLMQRITKRAEVIEKAGTAADRSEETEAGVASIGDAAPHGFLTPHQKQVQQMVLRRRGGA